MKIVLLSFQDVLYGKRRKGVGGMKKLFLTAKK